MLDSEGRKSSSAAISIAVVVVLSGCTVTADPPVVELPPAPPPLSQNGMPLGNIEDPSTLSPEWLDATARYDRCMKEDGWAFRDGPAGAVFGFPEGQADAFAESERRCEVESGREGLTAGAPLTDDELERGHAALLASWQCMTGLGFNLAPPPSLQSFIDEDAIWTPYAALTPTEFDEAVESCPQPR